MFVSSLFKRARRAVVLSVALVSLIGSAQTRAGDSQFVVRVGRHPAEARILGALDEPTELAFIEAPLSDVIFYLKDKHGFEIVPDQLALDDAGVGTDQPVTIELSGISLRAALTIMLRNLQLTYTVQDEVLMITTPEEQSSRLITEVYAVGDLVEDATADELADVLRAMHSDTSGEGQIVAYRNMLLVRDTDQAHQEIVKLLSLMRQRLEENHD